MSGGLSLDDVLNGISVALYTHFGNEYRIYDKYQMQGFEKPCFFILPVSLARSYESSGKIRASNRFVITAYPEDESYILYVAEKLFYALELIDVESESGLSTLRAVFTDCETVFDKVVFTVDYDMIALRDYEDDEGNGISDAAFMENLDIENYDTGGDADE